MLTSIVIRTYNEQRHLGALLQAVAGQEYEHEVEVILVDSGSTDRTVEIAREHGCRIVTIDKGEFTFGRSLNLGCSAAQGDVLVFVSGHCIPISTHWLQALVKPVATGEVSYSYGRQLGGEGTRFSECQIFRKYYPEREEIPQSGFFCNNANAALARSEWQRFAFDEQLPGLEDMALAQKLVGSGGKIGYAASAGVYHLHDESWLAVKNRFEREAIALQSIMPQIHISFGDFLRYWISAMFLDLGAALQERKAVRHAPGIFTYRMMQYWGSYVGNHERRRLSRAMKDKYFYPK